MKLGKWCVPYLFFDFNKIVTLLNFRHFPASSLCFSEKNSVSELNSSFALNDIPRLFRKKSKNLLTTRKQCAIMTKVAERNGKTKTENAGVAQLVEQLICNQQVGGSSPSTSSIFFFGKISYGRFPEWPKGTDCKSVVYDFGGSNPPPPTMLSKHYRCGGLKCPPL